MKIEEWYLIENKADDYGNCSTGLVCCENKKEIAIVKKFAYYSEKVDKDDVKVLIKYFNNVKELLDDGQDLKQYLELYY